MWKYISGVLKVIEEEKKEKKQKAACDSKEYEKNRVRTFSVTCRAAWLWLHNGGEGGRGGKPLGE